MTETLQPLPEDRKCFRLINGVLVERTVKDVLPALKTNSDGLKQVLEELLKQYKGKEDEMNKWKVRIVSGVLVVIGNALTYERRPTEEAQHPSSAELRQIDLNCMETEGYKRPTWNQKMHFPDTCRS